MWLHQAARIEPICAEACLWVHSWDRWNRHEELRLLSAKVKKMTKELIIILLTEFVRL